MLNNNERKNEVKMESIKEVADRVAKSFKDEETKVHREQLSLKL